MAWYADPSDGVRGSEDLFQSDTIDLPFTDDGGTIRHLAVGNGMFVFVLDKPDGSWEVMHYDLEDTVTLYTKTKHDENVHKIFVHPKDPSHVLLSLTNGDLYHITVPSSAQSPTAGGRGREEKKVKCWHSGVVVEAVGWNKSQPDGVMLLGDVCGNIYEAQLGKKCRIAFNLGTQLDELLNVPVAGIQIEHIRADTGYTYSGRLLVFVTAASSLLQFTMPTSFGLSVFAPQVLDLLSMGLPDPSVRTGDIHLYRDDLDNPPETFAWVTPTGIMHGQIDLLSLVGQSKKDKGVRSSQQSGSVLSNRQELRFDSPHMIDSLVGLMVTDFYFFLLYKDELRVVSQPPGIEAPRPRPAGQPMLTSDDLTKRTIWRKRFQPSANHEAQGLVWDAKAKMLYVQTRKFIHEVSVECSNTTTLWKSMVLRARDENERSKVKKAYLDIALKMCHGDQTKTRRVRIAQADMLFENGEYGQAAKIYAAYTDSFESTAIKFVQCGRKDMLLQYLLTRLEIMRMRRLDDEDTQEATQTACLTTWIVQTYLSLLNSCTDEYDRADYRDEFRSFLEDHRKDLLRLECEELIASLGSADETMYFVELYKKNNQLISQYVVHDRLREALDCLIEDCNHPKYEGLWYQYSPRLILFDAEKLVTGWMVGADGGPNTFLKPPRLIPALIKYEEKYEASMGRNQAIRYLEWLVTTNNRKQANTDQSVHNMLLSMYAKQRTSDRDLMAYLESSRAMPYYDESYALRLCIAEGKNRACVFLYEQMGLFEDAVTRALSADDVDLAKEVAMRAKDAGFKSRKRLWIQIGEYIINADNRGPREAIAMLDEARQVGERTGMPVEIELEDLLPLFPDFKKIKDYKEEIQNTLVGYNSKMNDIRRTMDKIKKAADRVRTNEETFARKRFAWVHAARKCNICSQYVLTASFYIFPRCDHVFHEHCLVRQVELTRQDQLAKYLQNLPLAERVRDELEAQETARSLSVRWADEGFALREKVEDFLGDECYMCGDMKVDEILTPFISARDKLRQEKTWKI